MNPLAASFVGIAAVALIALPRRWAVLPLICGACYMTIGQGVDVGPFTFTVIRILVAVGVIRTVIRRERISGGLNGLDWLMVSWGLWVLLSGQFHNDPETGLVFRLGLVYNAGGIYFLLRVFCSSREDVIHLCRLTAVLLIPVAAEMVYEHIAFHNFFSVFGGVPSVPQVREGKIRAFGPFTHPILAGTVGAVVLPLMIGLWNRHRRTAVLGVVVCIAIVIASASSGPAMSAMAAIAAVCMWPQRDHMRAYRWAAAVVYLVLNTVMNVPAYYLISRIDITGGSTGWHRARLIEMALTHLNEWWAVGTDFTRHWMPTGVTWNANHTDITNHYLYMGVLGGLPLMFLFIGTLVKCFSYVGRSLKASSEEDQFFVWTLGAGLFAHTATCISVSYFDQSFLFLYLTQAAIASACAGELVKNKAQANAVAPARQEPKGRPQPARRFNPTWRHANTVPYTPGPNRRN